MPYKEPLRAIIRALQDTHDRAAGFRGEGELASRWTKLNCDCGTVLYVNLRVLNILRLRTSSLEVRGCFEMTAVRAQTTPTTPMSDSDRCRFDVQSVCMKAWEVLGWASSGDTSDVRRGQRVPLQPCTGR